VFVYTNNIKDRRKKNLIQSRLHCQFQQLHLNEFDPEGLQLIPFTTAKVTLHMPILQSSNSKETNN